MLPQLYLGYYKQLSETVALPRVNEIAFAQAIVT